MNNEEYSHAITGYAYKNILKVGVATPAQFRLQSELQKYFKIVDINCRLVAQFLKMW